VVIINRLFEHGPLYGVTQPSWPDVPASRWGIMKSKKHRRIIDIRYCPTAEKKQMNDSDPLSH